MAPQDMRSILRLPSNSISSMVYGELGRMPLQHRWQKQVLKFWNRLLETPNELLRAALLENYRLTRRAVQLDVDASAIWCCQIEKLILEFAPPGSLSVYEELDIRQYSNMFFNAFRVETLSSDSSMAVYFQAKALLL